MAFIPEGAHFEIPAQLREALPSPTQSHFTFYSSHAVQGEKLLALASLLALCCLLLYVHTAVKTVAISSVNLNKLDFGSDESQHCRDTERLGHTASQTIAGKELY